MSANARVLEALDTLLAASRKRPVPQVRGRRGGDGEPGKLYRYQGVVVRVHSNALEAVRMGGELVPATGANAGLAPLPKRLRRQARELAKVEALKRGELR